MNEILSVLIVEDNQADVDLIREALPETGPVSFLIESVSRLSEALARLKSGGIDLVLLDLGLPDSRGLETFHRLLEATPHIPVIILTGDGNQEIAVLAVREGAQDYLVKGQIGGRQLTRSVLYAVERNRAEELLLAANHKYQQLAESISDVFFAVDRNLRYTYWNKASEKITGIPAEKALGKSLLEIFPDNEARRQVKDMLLLAIEAEKPQSLIVSYPGNDLIIHEISFYPTREGVSVFVKDITERMRAEIRLKESQSRYQSIFEATGTATLIVEDDTTIKMANNECLQATGYSPEELIGTKWTNYVAPESLEIMLKYHKLRREDPSKVPRKYEVRLLNKNGEIRNVVLDIGLIPDTKQGVVSMLDITKLRQAEEKLKGTLDSLRKAVNTTIQVMVSAVEARDPYTAGHQVKSANLACAIATEMGLPQDKIEGIRMAGSIHDIGKLSIPAEILSKPIKLSEIEFALIKQHPRQGFEMLKDVESPWPLAEIVYQHHERMDGSGYPRKLQGEEICLEARIIAVSDVVEAMASHRPYRPGLGIDVALNEIEKNKGIFYDSAVVAACLKLFREKGFKLEGN